MNSSAATASDYDLIIVGGGATGSALALMLAQAQWRVLLIEKQAVSEGIQAPHYDERSIALSFGSQQILRELGVWPVLQPHAAAIEHIHISDRGHFGHAQLHASEYGIAALGQVIELRALNHELQRAVLQRGAAEVMAPAAVLSYQDGAEQIKVKVSVDGAERELSAALLLACDGAQSSLRKQAGIGVEVQDYGQCAIVANVSTELPAAGRAFERFCNTGPLALLPLTQARMSLVWSLMPDQAEQHMHYDEGEFLRRLQQAFGWRLGRFTRVGVRNSFALQRIVSCTRNQGRLLLMGNAAQQLHPVAGQGFNLALRDASDLAAHLTARQTVTANISPALIHAFLQDRRADSARTLTATDALVRVFSNDYAALSPIRALALDALALLPVARERLALTAMGLSR